MILYDTYNYEIEINGLEKNILEIVNKEYSHVTRFELAEVIKLRDYLNKIVLLNPLP